MIDAHCHILPGLDDGPSDMDESLAMLRMAADDGIRTVVATPHFGGRFSRNDCRPSRASSVAIRSLRYRDSCE